MIFGRQHSDTFILQNSIKETKTVRELVERYEGWGKESGTFGSTQEPFQFGQKSLHGGDGLEGSPMKKRRLAMPGAPGHPDPEHPGPSPGPVIRKQKSSSSSLKSSLRPRSSPGRCSGPRRRMSVLPPPSSTKSPVPTPPPWVESRGPGSKRTLGGTPPPPMSYTRGSWPVHGIAGVNISQNS